MAGHRRVGRHRHLPWRTGRQRPLPAAALHPGLAGNDHSPRGQARLRLPGGARAIPP